MNIKTLFGDVFEYEVTDTQQVIQKGRIKMGTLIMGEEVFEDVPLDPLADITQFKKDVTSNGFEFVEVIEEIIPLKLVSVNLGEKPNGDDYIVSFEAEVTDDFEEIAMNIICTAGEYGHRLHTQISLNNAVETKTTK